MSQIRCGLPANLEPHSSLMWAWLGSSATTNVASALVFLLSTRPAGGTEHRGHLGWVVEACGDVASRHRFDRSWGWWLGT